MYNFLLSIGEKDVLACQRVYYLDEFLNALMRILTAYKTSPGDKLSETLVSTGQFKSLGTIKPDASEPSAFFVAENSKLIKYMPKTKTLFFSDGNHDFMYDLEYKVLSLGSFNGTVRTSAIKKNVGNLKDLLGHINYYLSRLCKETTSNNKAVITKLNQKMTEIKTPPVSTDTKLNASALIPKKESTSIAIKESSDGHDIINAIMTDSECSPVGDVVAEGEANLSGTHDLTTSQT